MLLLVFLRHETASGTVRSQSLENCGIIWQSGTVRSYKPFWKPRGATTKFSSFLLRSELLQAWPQNQPILDYGWFCKGVELAQVYHQQRYTKMNRKKQIPHTGNTRPSRTCVIQENRFYTMSLRQYYGCCQYHESLSIP